MKKAFPKATVTKGFSIYGHEVRTGGESVNPYNPSTSESTLTSQYISFGLTWRIGRTEMESQQIHGKKPSGKKAKKDSNSQ